MKKGQLLESGFTVLDIVEIDELQARGIWAKHEKSGVEVFHILNNDSENLFAFAFATAPEDNTGVAHILEHSVLCGSRNYPLKDAFLVLAQGSLQTFLNAWTFPDKTVYPAGSVNEHDYFNLMAVYGDAVFRPLLSEWTFMQEGHRLDFSSGGASGKNSSNNAETAPQALTVNGVVYNEMKGAYSSLDTYAQHWSVKAVMPGTPYSFESGGDPRHIPELSWDGLKEFHRRRYSPANCKIFLAGNIETEKQLAFLNEKFFAEIEPGTAADPVARTERWIRPKQFYVPCPAGAEQKSTVFLSWLCSDITDAEENLALAALAEILLGHDGSPLTRALVESGIGEDISPVSGMEGEIRETLFVAGLRGVSGAAEDAGRQTEDLIIGELKRLADEGIPPEETEAALVSMEFSQKEIRRAGGPFSLVWMRLALRGWLHGSKPWETLLFTPVMEKLKRRLAADNRYFESLIRKYLLDNPHRALVILEPKEDFLPNQEARFAEELAARERNLSETEQRAIIEKSAGLEKIQNEEDSPEALAAIPHLSRSDLAAKAEYIPRRVENIAGIPALCHELHTNGISYFDLAFPVDNLSLEDYLWLPFFSRAVVSVGLPGLDYGEVSGLLARTAGGFSAKLQSGSPASVSHNTQTPPDLLGRDWLICRLKCLDEKARDSLDLAVRLLLEADFSDERHIRDLVLEMKSDFDSSLAPMGHSYASHRSGRFASRTKSVEEMWRGLSQINFVHHLSGLDTAQIIAKLENMRRAITGSGLIANITGNAAALKAGTGLLKEKFGGFGPPLPVKTSGTAFAEAACDKKEFTGAAAEVFASASLQVGFAAASFRAAAFDTPAQAAETVLAHQLSTGALWEEFRMKGGAYGAYAASDSLENYFSLATYRDPNPLRSLDSFSAILKNFSAKYKEQSRSGRARQEDDLVKMIIGCYARETRPRTSAEKGVMDFFRYLYGIEDSYRKRKLERLIAVTPEDIFACLESLTSQTSACPVIITGIKDAKQAAKILGTEPQTLPV